MYTYIYYFILNEEQRKRYIIDNITDPGKHIRVNIGEGVKLYNVYDVSTIQLNDNYILYRTDFTSDIYIPNLRNAQITKTFYSLQKDLYGNECREDIELNKDFEFMKRKLCEIKLKEDKNELICEYVRGKTFNMPSKNNKFYYSYTYFFTLFNNDVNKYILHDSSDDYICTYRLDESNIGNYYVTKIKDNNIRTCYAVAFETKTKNTACERGEMIYKTLFSNVDSSPKENVRFFSSLEKLYEYYGVNNKKETKNNMSIESMNNYACVSAGCMTNEHVGLEIKKVKYNGPATIVFWNDGTKTVAKCQEDMSNYKAEKGLAMAISKKVIKSEYYAIKDIKIGHNDNSIIIYWEHGTEAEIKFDNHVCDFEYCIALARVKKFFGSKTKNNTKWYEKFKSYLPKEEKKPLVVHLYGHLGESKKPDTTCEDFMPKPNTHKETEQEFVLRLFNEGYSLKKISDKTGVTMYHVRRYIDEATKPDKFKNKETKKSSNKKPRTYHKLRDLEDPSWLLPEECKDIREVVKEKFKDKHMTMSLLQKEYIRECRKYKLKQCYGNGYSMYELAKIIGDTNAAGLMRIWNDMNKEGV